MTEGSLLNKRLAETPLENDQEIEDSQKRVSRRPDQPLNVNHVGADSTYDCTEDATEDLTQPAVCLDSQVEEEMQSAS